MEKSKPIDWSHLMLLVIALSLHHSCHAQASTWPGTTLKEALNKTHFSYILIAFLFFIVFFIFFSLLIRHCVDTCAAASVHISPSAAAADRRSQAIEKCPVFAYSEVKDRMIGNSALECAVCLTEFDDADDKIRLLHICNHVFHMDCIDRWLSSCLTCPVCRAKLSPADPSEPDNPDDGSPESSQSPAPAPEESPETAGAGAIGADDEGGSGGGIGPGAIGVDDEGGIGPRVGPGPAAGRLGRSHSTGRCRVMESEGVMERYTLRLPEHVREEVVRKEDRRRLLRRCGSSSDVVLRGEWDLKVGCDYKMERWVLMCNNMTSSLDWSSVKFLKMNDSNHYTDQSSFSSSSSSSSRPPV